MTTLWLIVLCGVLALIYAIWATGWVLRANPDSEKMQEIAAAVRVGAQAYLRRQYTTIAVVGIVIFLIVGFLLGWLVAVGFAVGAILSGAAGFIGMNVSVRANVRTAQAAISSLAGGLEIAFRAGAITGLLVAGLALLGVTLYFMFLTGTMHMAPNDREVIDSMVALGFGASLISIFARLGGGIFTKGADVGGDLVGKVEAGIPEDDPRNPATIADNVGDNVGDCAGMAADLFETYAVTAIAVILLGVLTFHESTQVALYPLVIGGVAIIASIIGTFAVRTNSGNVERALLQGLLVSGVLAAAAFAPVTYWLMRNLTFKVVGSTVNAPSWSHLYLCSLIGIVVTALLFGLTEYYTSTRFSPVKKTAKASITGHATNIIQGFASGLQATALPAIVIVLGILGSWKLAGGGVTGIYGIGVAAVGLLSLTGLIVALDAFGPITDNAGGIAEMADLPEDVRKVTDRLDAVGNTTKAVTKGYAIGSAALAALVLFNAFEQQLDAKVGHLIQFEIDYPPVLIGLLIGGMMVYLFAALSMESVGRAGSAVVEEVRPQFREKPGIMDGWELPDYGQCVDIVTKSAQREMILPALIPI